jgi:hypothetical protein
MTGLSLEESLAENPIPVFRAPSHLQKIFILQKSAAAANLNLQKRLKFKL